MRTLFVSTTVPYPLNSGGNQRIFHLIRALAGVSQLTLVCPTEGGQRPSELDAIQPFVHRTVVFPREWFEAYRTPRGGWLERLRRVLWFHGHPLEPALLRWYRFPAGPRMIADLCDPSFDLIWVERLISTGLIPQSVRGRVIVDLDDIQYRKMGHRLRQPRLHPLTLLDVLEFFKLRRVERKLVRGSGEYIVCSDLDKCALGGGEQIVVLPNGIDLPASGPAPLSSVDPPLLVLVGTMRTEANVDAAHFFVQRILPEIRRAVSHVRLMIVGSDPTESVRRLHDGHTVVVTGTVPRVEPYLRDAAISVVPIRFGGGTRIKILESLAHGVPLVSTTVGAEGLDVVDGRHLLLADSPAQFAAACVRLLRDVSLRRLLSQEGSELVRNMYDWAAIERRVQALVTGGPSPVDRALASLRKAGYTNPASP